MKILHVIESSGGSADFVLYLIKYLPQHEHTVAFSDRTFLGRLESVQQAFPQAKFVYWKNAQREIRLKKDWLATLALHQIFRTTKADVIHLHSSKAGFLGRVVGFLLRKRNVIYTPNGLAFLRQDVSKLKMFAYIVLEKVADLINGKVIACSKSEAQALEKYSIKCDFINNGTELSSATPKPFTPTNFTVATIGRITIQKNPALFNAIASHFRNKPEVKFVWIGAGELQHLITSPNIKTTGWLDREGVLNEASGCDLYLSTASWEGLPFAVIEAMNLAKPLLLTRCVGNVDLVKENYNGFLFNNKDEAIARINQLIGNPAMLTSFAANSHEIVRSEFGLEDMGRKYEQVYIEIFEKE